MAEDQQAATPNAEITSDPELIQQSMFSRKGLMVLVILMVVEAVVIFMFLPKIMGKKDGPTDSTKVGVQADFGEVIVQLPSRSVDERDQQLVFSFHIGSQLKETVFTDKIAPLITDNVKRKIKSDIRDRLSKRYFANPQVSTFKQKDSVARTKEDIKVIVNKVLKNEYEAKYKKLVDFTIVDVVYFDSWQP